MKISALISDVDGTLVTHDKTADPATRDAVAALQERGIAFAITSGRPPRGMRMLVEPLGAHARRSAASTAASDHPTRTWRRSRSMRSRPRRRGRRTTSSPRRRIDVWVFSGLDWLLPDPDGPHVAARNAP